MSRVKLLFENIYLYFRYGLRKRDNQIILFGSWFGNKFADNSRFLFQYLAENKEKYGFKKVVWATRNEKVFNALEALGYTVVMIGTKESDYYHKIAGIHVVCNAGSSTNASEGDIDGKFSFGAIRINLWHGIPAKGVDYASIEYKKREKAHGQALYEPARVLFIRHWRETENRPLSPIYSIACATATATATVMPTIGLLPAPKNPIIST